MATTHQPQDTMAALAQETDTSLDLVQALYKQEIAALEARATVRSFIGVIASRRVKAQLRALGSRASTAQLNTPR